MLKANGIDLLTPDDIRRENWRKDALEDERNFSKTYLIRKEDLLKRTHVRKLEIIDCRGTGELNRDGAPLLHMGFLNNWFVETCYWESHNDFSIRVAVPIREIGSKQLDFRLQLHPEVIEEVIVSKTNQQVYAEWKRRLMGDIDSLKVLLDAMRKTMDYSCRSLTCSERSKRFCLKAGLPMEGDWTALTPEVQG